jgi:hypothetical protein
MFQWFLEVLDADGSVVCLQLDASTLQPASSLSPPRVMVFGGGSDYKKQRERP